MLPLPGSPAIRRGTVTLTDHPNTDQRGFARSSVDVSTIDLGAVQTNYLIVTTTTDVSDGSPACTSGTGNTCSLRDALTVASTAGSSDITFASGVIGTISLSSTLGTLPTIAAKLDLFGPGANILTVSGGGSSAVGSVFIVTSSNAAFSGITSANGNSNGSGGAIISNGTLTVSNSAFSGNNSPYGGGIYSVSGTLIVTNSTFSGNTASFGGGIFDDTGTLIVTNSTFSGNSASNAAGGIYVNNGTLAVTNSTFSGNTGGGIIIDLGTLTVNNSILTGDSGGECSGTGCPVNGTNGNVVIATPSQPMLAPLGWYGGPTQTMLPLTGSPAICAGSVSLIPGGVTTDQRGFARLNLASGCVDAGAVQTNYLIVTNTTDVSDGSPACTTGTGTTCSLRDALTLAATNGSADIAFASTVTGSIAVNGTLPPIAGNLDLFGPGVNNLTVSGGNSPNLSGIFSVTSPNAAISGITIANGNNTSTGNGGGIFNSGTLTLSNTALSANTAASFGGAIFNQGTLAVINSTLSGANNSGAGGGIFNGGTMTVTNSTVSGNASAAGGGIFNSATLWLTNSTFSGNNASGGGGGINNSGGTLTMNNSTVSGNTAGSLGGGIVNISTLTLTNNIVAGNTTTGDLGDDCDDCGNPSSNLISQPGAIINPLLAPLGSYGGPTQTMLPLPGSPTICAGSAALNPGLLYDQRGFPRLNTTYNGYIPPDAPCLDLGAVQTNYQSVQFAKSAYSGKPGVAISSPAAPVVSVTENGQNTGAVPVTLSFSGTAPSSVSGTGPVTTVAGTGATFSSLTASPGGSYTLQASLTIVGSATISNTAGLNIDTPATVTSLTSTASGTYTTTATISIVVNFNKAVTVTGTPKLALNSGGTASYASGTSTAALTFTYTVASSQSTTALDASSTTALTLNSGTITDASSVAANLTLPTPGGTGSLSANTTIVINTTQYKLTLAASPSADGSVAASPTSTPNVTPSLPTGTYLSCTQVKLTATPANSNYKFSSWSSGSTSNPLTITMTGNISETANFVANTVNVTVGTSPAGLSFSVDGKTYTSSQMFTWNVGTQHTLATATPQRVTGIDYESPTWSDGGAISHTVTASLSTTSYTVTFEIYYQLTTASSPSAGGQVTPNLGGYYPAGSVVSIQAVPTSGYSFKNWTGNVAKTTSASTTVTMTGPETVTANFAKK
jgi:hypothetical protein